MIRRKLNIHYFQHEKYEQLFAIEDWVVENGHNLSRTFFKTGEPLPDLENVDWLIIMGGSMSVNDEKSFPWLIEEKKFIEKAIRRNKTVIGICLGAQLIANVLGSKIFKNRYKEIGWYPIRFTDAADANPLFRGVPEFMTVFHWHSETFDLPDGAVLMAVSEACENQIFEYNSNIIGLQCHLEQTEVSIRGMLKYGNKELIKDRYIQTFQEILEGMSHINDNRALLNRLLKNLSI